MHTFWTFVAVGIGGIVCGIIIAYAALVALLRWIEGNTEGGWV
jgi:uncharacterized membrane protein YesL